MSVGLYKFSHIESWTLGKAGEDYPLKNEDVVHVSDSLLVLADGATDKTGVRYESGKTGGREVAEVAVRVASATQLTGYDLADEITEAVRRFYKEHNPSALEDASRRAASTLVVVGLTDSHINITQIGDTAIRITEKDGTETVYRNDKRIDLENSVARAANIAKQLADAGQPLQSHEFDAIVEGSRSTIQTQLDRQYTMQNNVTDPLYGYGVIDGQVIPRTFFDGTPTNFVKTMQLPAQDVVSIEVVSDGFYGEFPEERTIQAYRELYERVHREDPAKYRKYLSTKSIDDASVIVAHV